MLSPYERLQLDGLHPRLVAYFSTIPSGSVGRGDGIFDVVGTPRRWLWPVLWVLGRQGVVFPFWGSVPFTVTNQQTDAGLAAMRTFQFPTGPRSMSDLMSARDGGLRDELGSHQRYRVDLVASVVDNGALRLRSVRMSVRLGRIHLPIPATVSVTERWDDTVQRQHVAAFIDVPVVGRVYEYAGYFDYAVLDEGGADVPAP